jgi:tetratricopeptide (TPR) repeat protein
MARHDRRAQQKRQGGQGTREREQQTQLTEEQQSALDALLGEIPALAQALRAAEPGGREALAAQLERIEGQSEPVALAFMTRLGTMRGPEARDAADIAQAVGELGTRREVAREARRSRLRLRSAGFHPSLTVPPAPIAPLLAGDRGAVEQELPAPIPLRQRRARLVEAHATRTREGGEVTLILGWQEGIDPDFVRGYIFQLDFWHDGVRNFRALEPMRRKSFLAETVERLRVGDEPVPTVNVSWAQARRLVLESLSVNGWRGTEPAQEFQGLRQQIDERLLSEPDDEDLRDEITRENERVEREGDRFLMTKGLEPEESLANWVGAWSLGDYGLAYDLLSPDTPMRRTQTRNEFIAQRRQWASEAKPGALRLTLIREQQRRASALWVPGSTSIVGGSGRDFEAFWSLVLDESPLGGQLDELPMGTLVSTETGRHWFWTGYSMTQDRAANLWLISRLRDEGAASQALTIEELQSRIKEARETAEKTAQAAPADPRSQEAVETVRTVTGALTTALHYYDALIVRLPLDEGVYREAVDLARTLSNHERAVALLEKTLARFPNQETLHFELGVEQYLVAEQYAAQGQPEAATAWLDRAIATMRQVVEKERTAEHLQGLGELLARRGHLGEAEEIVREGLGLEPERASLHADLASILMARISGENIQEPETLTDEQRNTLTRDALAALREAARLDRTLPRIFTRMGAIYEVLNQPDDARLAFEEALRNDPGDADAHYALGSLLLRRQDAAGALPHLERAVEMEPMAVPYRLALAAGYVAQERKREATRELDLIDRLQPGLPQVGELRTILNRQKK